MEIEALINLIPSVGFPCAACVGMFIYFTKVMDKRDDKIDKTLRQMTSVVNENNKMISIFTEKMDLIFKIIEERERNK